jgi:hypothetical protein
VKVPTQERSGSPILQKYCIAGDGGIPHHDRFTGAITGLKPALLELFPGKMGEMSNVSGGSRLAAGEPQLSYGLRARDIQVTISFFLSPPHPDLPPLGGEGKRQELLARAINPGA